MKMLLIVVCLMMSSLSFSQTELLKAKATEVKKMACTVVNGKEECTVTDVKKKGCPVVNGKEDCTVTEVKTKVLEMKKKITY